MSKCNPPLNDARIKAPRMVFNMERELEKVEKKPYLDPELKEMRKQIDKEQSPISKSEEAVKPKSELEIIIAKINKFESGPKAQYPKTMRGPDVWAVYTEHKGKLYSVVKGDDTGSFWKLEEHIGHNEYQEVDNFNKRKDALDEIPYL